MEIQYGETASEDQMLAATYGRGLWKSGLQINNSAFTISPTSISFDKNGGSATLEINCESSWEITENCDWLSVSKEEGSGSASISIICEPNAYAEEKMFALEVSANATVLKCLVKQSGGEPILSVNPQMQEVTFEQSEIEVEVKTQFVLKQKGDPSGIEESSSSIQISPNPCNESLQLTLDKDTQKVQIINMKGEVVFEKANPLMTESIQTASWEVGSYVVQRFDGAKVSHQKFIVVH